MQNDTLNERKRLAGKIIYNFQNGLMGKFTLEKAMR